MSSDTEETCLLDDNDETQLLEQVSRMSPEELQKLRNELGSKIFDKVILNKESGKPKHQPKHKHFLKRKSQKDEDDDDDMPVEVSAKRKVPPLINVIPVKKPEARDPRFDKLCGEFDPERFKKSYSFISKLKENDIKALQKELKISKDPEEIKKIRYLIQRLENQLREEKNLKKRKQAEEDEKKKINEAIKKGEKPVYLKKSEKKIVQLVSRFEELKKSGKLKDHIEKMNKKKFGKEMKKKKKEKKLLDNFSD